MKFTSCAQWLVFSYSHKDSSNALFYITNYDIARLAQLWAIKDKVTFLKCPMWWEYSHQTLFFIICVPRSAYVKRHPFAKAANFHNDHNQHLVNAYNTCYGPFLHPLSPFVVKYQGNHVTLWWQHLNLIFWPQGMLMLTQAKNHLTKDIGQHSWRSGQHIDILKHGLHSKNWVHYQWNFSLSIDRATT